MARTTSDKRAGRWLGTPVATEEYGRRRTMTDMMDMMDMVDMGMLSNLAIKRGCKRRWPHATFKLPTFTAPRTLPDALYPRVRQNITSYIALVGAQLRRRRACSPCRLPDRSSWMAGWMIFGCLAAASGRGHACSLSVNTGLLVDRIQSRSCSDHLKAVKTICCLLSFLFSFSVFLGHPSDVIGNDVISTVWRLSSLDTIEEKNEARNEHKNMRRKSWFINSPFLPRRKQMQSGEPWEQSRMGVSRRSRWDVQRKCRVACFSRALAKKN